MIDRAPPAALVLGLVYDRLLGEPPDPIHPVALLGRGLTALEARTYADDRSRGVLHLAIGLAAGAVGAAGLRRVLGPAAATIFSVGTASAGTMLVEVATDVGDRLAADDVEGARTAVRTLVGRDPTALDENEIARAVVESVAENTVDAVTATLFWAAAAGPVGVWVHRCTNTLDAMVGHRSPRYRNFGWASARLDDGLNWLPARLTALAVAIAAPRRAGAVLSTVRRDGRSHPSPNGGMVEAAFAGALGIRLGGTNDYGGRIEVRGTLGDGRAPVPGDIARAVALAYRVSWVTAGLVVVGAAIADRCSTVRDPGEG